MWSELGAFFGGLIASLVKAIRGEPAPEPAATKPPAGMTANEQAALARARAGAESAKGTR
jgi:hypothetical protein